MHESRHLHALKRSRGKLGRFESTDSQNGEEDTETMTTATQYTTSYATPINNIPLIQTTPTLPILPNPIPPGHNNNTGTTGMSALDEFKRIFGSSVTNKDVEEALRGMVQSGLVDLQHCSNEDTMTGTQTMGSSEQ